MLLVGPPGTGKTLIARAVAGEAGVPFLSVTGSDFMEMFVGVGASRVRDLFQTARKLGRAIIFVDEIDSIGRKRGAGLGGGHDEREQTLNQMLSEMDGFEATEGIVMMAATNRPDILDPALLRPGRFDRQVVVPLPELDERRAILEVHCKHKRLAADVDLDVVARGTPGMSGADLANLVNEAALFAVRAGHDEIRNADFEQARDRVLMGAAPRVDGAVRRRRRRSSPTTRPATRCAPRCSPHADPVHKVTILPTGMALGVTQQLPVEERHIYQQDYIEDSLVVRMGGRIAEELVFGVISTGANNDLVGSTELARKMVREWGMSTAVGPMAWGSQGEVFLGEDLMHTRDYSDETARVIDEEVERILREQEDRCREMLTRAPHRASTSSPGRCSSTRRSTAPRSPGSSASASGAVGARPATASTLRSTSARRRGRTARASTPSDAGIGSPTPPATPGPAPPRPADLSGPRRRSRRRGRSRPAGSEPGSRSSATRRPQVGGGDRPEEGGPHHAVGVGDHHRGHGVTR